MIGRRTDDWKPNGNVDTVFPGQQFQRNEPLIVVETDHPIKFSSHRPHKNRIGRKWSFHNDPLQLRLSYGRSNNPLFFVAERARLASVRVQTSDRETRMSQAMKAR